MTDELFPVQESRNALSSARKALELAIDEENRAEEVFENQGPEAWPSYEDASRAREDAERKVAELERAEIAAWKK